MAPTYRDHDPSEETVESVDGMKLAGARVMVGRFPDGSLEFALTTPALLHSESAAHEFEHGTLPERLLPE
jgi:hypothetical protein